MKSISEIIYEIGVVPVIKLDEPEGAPALARALIEGGVPVAEVTFRTAAAEEGIRRMSAETPEILVGAGTVISAEQVDKAKAAGAKFIVSPGLSAEVVKRSQALGLPVFPGCATASELMEAIALGLSIVKFFPAGNLGGLKTIKALAPVFPQLRFMPTGGVSAVNLKEYLEFGKIYACGGSWMVTDDLAETTRLCAEARAIVKSVRG